MSKFFYYFFQHETAFLLVNAYGLNGMGVQAIELYSRMPKEFIHEATYVSILNACSHSGLIDEARSIFKSIENKNEKIYTAMVCQISSFVFG